MNEQIIKYCIVDDEPIAHRIIEGYCEELPYLQKVGNAYNALEASSVINLSLIHISEPTRPY